MEPFQQVHESFYHVSPWIQRHSGLQAGLTTRYGGVSQSSYASLNMGLHVGDTPEAVMANRHRLAKQVNIAIDHWVLGEQVHGTKIARIDHNSEKRGAGSNSTQAPIPGVDGLITKERNILLAAFFADCVPLYFYDPITGWLGIAHAGWRGTVNGMAIEMVKALQQEGVETENLQVAIGPSISQMYYQVNLDVINCIPQIYRDLVSIKIKEVPEQYLLDLRQLNKHMLMDQGINREHILVSHRCTYQTNNLYSYRRDHGKTGRMLGFIGKY
ncbi:peptidoglycan editing factor PgeF [Amphibacillus cookii]|uniref:peptidoglycan editing factor PgeF n=1 Tax=Amphibacillus cookii TaxID=767787 RepID=UPI001957F00E|nr:peptidoglycan editing factor PgeF [Amphibacillus cookii]MBM7540496.1 YfiH family protein [Amphibacillus cookii]